MKAYDHGIKEKLISETEIQTIVKRLGEEITLHYQNSDKELIIVGLLRGSFVFMADLVREIKVPLVTDFMTVSSYGNNTKSSGNVKVVMDLDESIDGKNLLLIEDIIDTGNTFSNVIQMLGNRNPADIKICTFLDKPSRREKHINIDFCGKEIPDEFVVGYGLDYAQEYRNLPFVGVMDEDAIK
jgi:hypoxanthine phosphoribosyltransferase